MSYKHRLEHITTSALQVKTSAHSALCRAGSAPSQYVSTSIPPAVPIPQLSLPLPESITPSLRKAGCSDEAARSLSDAFLRSAHQIRDIYYSTHHQTCTKIVQNVLSDPGRMALRLQNLSSFLSSQYQERILAAEKLAIHRVEDMQQSRCTTRKTMFNPEFVPLLEKYFEYNAYPSAPDRAALARKSMMTPRQIEVWFQNHRNRSKKEGKPLRRLTLDTLPIKLSLESLEQKMPFFIIPEADRRACVGVSENQYIDKDDQVNHITKSYNLKLDSTFNLKAPIHAYPTTYPPHCDYDPFPSRTNTHTFAPPLWTRTPAKTLPFRSTLTIKELIAEFSVKLVIRDSPSQKHRQNGDFSTPSNYPWFTATHMRPPPAPHPAFIHPSVSPERRSPPISRLSQLSIPAIPAKNNPFRSPSPLSRPLTLVSPTERKSPSRKVVPLFRRSPTASCCSHRGASPPGSNASSSSRYIAWRSSTSLFNSNPPSARHLSSPSSCSSSSLSTPNTPTLSPTPLPTSIHSPVVRLDLNSMDDMFSGLEEPHTPLDGLQHKFHLPTHSPSLT